MYIPERASREKRIPLQYTGCFEGSVRKLKCYIHQGREIIKFNSCGDQFQEENVQMSELSGALQI